MNALLFGPIHVTGCATVGSWIWTYSPFEHEFFTLSHSVRYGFGSHWIHPKTPTNKKARREDEKTQPFSWMDDPSREILLLSNHCHRLCRCLCYANGHTNSIPNEWLNVCGLSEGWTKAKEQKEHKTFVGSKCDCRRHNRILILISHWSHVLFIKLSCGCFQLVRLSVG